MQSYITFSDIELLRLLKELDHAAFKEIYNRYFYLIYTHAYKKLRNEELAKDFTQDVFTNLWLKKDCCLKVTNLGGYLFTAVRNRIFDFFAHQKVESDYITSLTKYITKADNEPADFLVRERELKVYIEREIEKLPSKMKLIFELSRKEQCSYQEISQRLQISENNVSKQLRSAIKRLRTKLGLIAFLILLHKFR
jgi:RNA polymerase sigma-70 factor (family 1)